ncbi:major capsid protein [Apis mellifera associated microvirus 23]|nr:major capsid protein [Apis mellifera associated microvirus 23]
MLGSRMSQHKFANVPAVNTARSSFDRSFQIKDTFDFDYLIPIFVDEILPGDTCNVRMSCFGRLATQLVPIMDNMYIDYFFFFVPNRLVWDNWERFNGAQDDPGDSTDFTIPQIEFATRPQVGDIYDHFGLPTGLTNTWYCNALPFRCYSLIWNEWFRDQNLQSSVPVPKDNGPDVYADFTLLKRGKRHDYFTSCLPWPQKGPDVTLPLASQAPVKSLGVVGNDYVGVLDSTNTPRRLQDNGTAIIIAAGSPTASADLFADLNQATAATINQLREAFLMQSLFELDARGGTRYVEILQAHFNVTSPDFRLQRPEFLGGGSSRINSHIVPQTSPTSGSDPQGQLAAFATTSADGIGFTKSFVEHGYVIGLACARADVTYQQGLNRMWSRSTRYDFFWPKLQELGEQEVLNREIYLQGTADDEAVFGYQERYAEYRYKPSEIRGQFRSTYSTSLDFWHMAEEFGSLPALNDTFIQQNTPVDRAIAIPTEPHLLFDAYFKYTHVRPMMTYSTPASLGRF